MDEIKETTALEDWEAIEKLFPTRQALSPTRMVYMGISSRLTRGRLARLMTLKGAGRLGVLLDQMEDARVKAMRTFAAINLEQANYAFKLTLIANVTAPLLVITFFNQITPGGVGDQLYDLYGGDRAGLYLLFGVIAFSMSMLFLLAMYALANLNQARDIRHLIDLFAAERGIYFGSEDSDGLDGP